MTKVRNHNLKGNRQGSAIIWILVWLTGLAGIAWAGYTFAIPRYEQKIQAAVHDAIAGHTDLPVLVAAKGNVVTLTGQAATAETLSSITDAAASAAGVRAVRSNMTLIGVAQPSDLISTNAEQVSQLDVTDPAIDPDTDSESKDPTPDTDVSESSLPPLAIADVDESDNKSDTDNAEPLAEVTAIESDDSSAQVASESQPTELPTFKMQIVDEILFIEGRISNSDDTNELIQNAMTSFNVDVVTNGLEYSDDVAKAEWLKSIEGVMPLMGLIKDPQISVLERQITLIGAAPNREVHDDVISQALNSLGEFSLVERVSIDPVPESTEVAAADTDLTSNASESTTATPIEEVIEAATTIEADPDVSIEPESLVKTQKPVETEVPIDPIDPSPPAYSVEPVAVVEPEAPVASAEPDAPAETEAPVEPVASAEPETPAETEAPVEPVAAAEPDTPAETEAPVEPIAAAEPDAPAESEATVEPVAAAEPETPAESEAAVEPVTAAEPDTPAESEATVEPVAAAEPDAPAESEATVEPVAAAEPETPAESEAAVEPVAAAEPETPAESEAPVEPVAAAEPDAPAETEAPVEPVAAAEPETPAETEAPVEPVAAAEPEAPAKTEATLVPVALAKTAAPKETEAAVEPLALADPEATTTAVSTKRQSEPNEELRKALSKLPTLRILFETDVNVLTAKSQSVLDQIAEALMRFPDTSIAIEGHTDATGDQTLNLELSLLRATTVRDYLIDKGVSVYNLRALGFGEEVPIADNQTAEGRAINRRIEFTF